MKKNTIQFMLILIILLAFQSFLPSLWAQSPQKMSYQAVVRNSSDKLVTDKVVGMKISILKGAKIGTAVYTETQKPTSNANGLVTVEIGTGTSIDDFSAIDWTTGPYFIKTETDPSGGTSYSISGVSELLSVPFALHAKTVEIDNVNDADADPTNEIQTLSISGTSLTLSKGGLTVTLPSSGGGDNWGTQTVVTNATLEGNGSTAIPLKIAKQSATNGQVLKWNGTTWAPGDDASGSSGLTLPYSQTVANSDFAFSITNSLNSAIKGVSSSYDGWGIVGEAPRFGIKATGGEVGLYGEASFTYGVGVQGVGVRYGIFGQGFYGVCGGSNDSEGFGVLGSSQSCGVKGEAGSDTGLGVLGYASSATGSTYGVKGYSTSSDGWGVYGESLNTGVKGVGNNFGVSGESSGSMGIGVHGVAPIYGVYGEGAYAVYGSYTVTGGYGVYGSSISCGVRGFSGSETGIGVLGNNPSGTGYTYGVKGFAGSENGTGVYGDGGQYGVYGESSSSNGIGVYGIAESYGVNGTSTSSYGAGVHGWGTKYGIYGECPTPSGYAGYFSGNLAITGNVGIGTSDPGYRLDVAGSINLNKGSTGSAIYCNGNEALWFDGDVFSWGYQSQLNYFARPVAIGTNSYTGYLLTVNGTAAKPGSTAWTTWSDSRLKDIQGNYEKGLKEIILLQPVKYNYKKDNACKLPYDINYVGFVAQDVQKVFPEAIAEGKDGYLTLDVNSINIALVNAVKELKTENDKLKERLTKLEKLMEANGMK
jgi:hypothetical protein